MAGMTDARAKASLIAYLNSDEASSMRIFQAICNWAHKHWRFSYLMMADANPRYVNPQSAEDLRLPRWNNERNTWDMKGDLALADTTGWGEPIE